MKCTTILTEFDKKDFLGDDNGELLDEIYFLESENIPYVTSVREVQYEIISESYDMDEGVKTTYYENLLDAMNAFDEMVKTLDDDTNLFLADVETGQIVADITNFGC